VPFIPIVEAAVDASRLPLAADLTPDGWKVRVRACFETLRIQQAQITVETLDGVEMEGRIESLDETKGRMVLSLDRAASAGLKADDEVLLFFTMHETRWMGRARIHYHNDTRNRFTLILPKRIDPSDRRRENRVFLDTAENVKATFLPSGAEHIQVIGRLSNLSEGGVRLAVESAQDVDTGRPIDPGDVLFEENQYLESFRITGLRERPVESQGIVLEVDPQPLGPILGIRFRIIPPAEQDFLRSFIQARSPAPAAVIPLPPEPKWPQVLPETPLDVFPVVHSVLDDHRLKRFKCLALIMPPGQDRQALQTFLATQGFTRVLPAGTLAELASLTRKSPPDAFLVDWPDATMPELDLVMFLGHHPFPSTPRIILACTHATTQLAREAHRLGVSHLLVKPYALDEALVELLLQQLSGE
jgi:CheY-like chemotaxis protein